VNLIAAIVPAARWSAAQWTLLAIAVVVVSFVTWMLIEARSARVSRAVVTSPHLPEAFEGTRVLFASDIHAGPYLGRKRMRALVDRMNDLEPDVVILGGDYVGGRMGGTAIFYPAIARLRSPLGVYAVLGNHDYWEGVEVAKQGFKDAGVALLVNENVAVARDGATIRIAGVDDDWMGTPDAALAASGIDAGEFAVIVSHTPDYFPKSLPGLEGLFDLALAGHMHGGQITLFGMHSPLVPSEYGQRYKGGWLEEHGTFVLVTRGVGSVTLPIRFFAPPEIHLIELRRGPAGITH